MNIRNDFPVFSRYSDLVYLDNASTTQKPQYVIDAVHDYMQNEYANIHRGQYKLAEISEQHYHDVREQCAKLLHVQRKNIFFSYNATYCSNIIAQSLCYSGFVGKNDIVLLGIWNHHASIVVRQSLQKIRWFEIVYIHVDAETHDMQIPNLDISRVKIVDVSHVSNVTGMIYDIALLRSSFVDACLIVDASQSVPTMSVDAQEYNCDILYFTGHKCMAYPGVGVCYVRQEWIYRLQPMIVGGGIINDVYQDSYSVISWVEKFSPGTPWLSSIISLGAALRYIDWIGGYSVWMQYKYELMKYMLERAGPLLQSHKLSLLGSQTTQWRSAIFSFVLDKNIVDVADFLAEQSICVRVGGHCAHPLLKSVDTQGVLRVSLYMYTTRSDIDQFFHVLENIL
jgi:cysteine desulfurase / selenocysteine lyase